MRKRVISPAPKELTSPDARWLDVEQLARVEVTSEDAAHPIEAALVPEEEAGWQAAQPGEPTIRLIRPAAAPEPRVAPLHRAGHGAHAGVRAALVAGRRAHVPGDSAAAMEFRATGDGSRGRRLPRRALRGDDARAGDPPQQERGRGAGVAHAVASGRLAARRCAKWAEGLSPNDLPRA